MSAGLDASLKGSLGIYAVCLRQITGSAFKHGSVHVTLYMCAFNMHFFLPHPHKHKHTNTRIHINTCMHTATSVHEIFIPISHHPCLFFHHLYICQLVRPI